MGKASAAVAARLRDDIAKAVRFIAVEATANLVEATPVDTGWARANWRATVGAPAPGTVGTQPTRRKGKRGRASVRAAAQISAAVARYKLGQGGIWITNNVPYINRLRNGWSPQAPAGWVERSLQRAITAARAMFGRR